MESTVQHQQSEIAQEASKDVSLRKVLAKAVLPPTTLIDKLGVVQGLDRGGFHCMSDIKPNADDWKREMKRQERLKKKKEQDEDEEKDDKQLIARHVKAHVAEGSNHKSKKMKSLTQMDTRNHLIYKGWCGFPQRQQSRMFSKRNSENNVKEKRQAYICGALSYGRRRIFKTCSQSETAKTVTIFKKEKKRPDGSTQQ